MMKRHSSMPNRAHRVRLPSLVGTFVAVAAAGALLWYAYSSKGGAQRVHDAHHRPALSGSRKAPGDKGRMSGPAGAGTQKSCVRGWKLVARLTDLVGKAQVRLPGLKAARRVLSGYWRWASDPYADWSMPNAKLLVMLGFPRPRLKQYVAGHVPKTTPVDLGPQRGVSVNKLGVLVPPVGKVAFPLDLPKGRILFRAWVGVVPKGRRGRATVTIRVGDLTTVRTIETAQRGIWYPVELDLTRLAGRHVTVAFMSQGPIGVVPVVASPLVWQEGACKAGRNIIVVVVDAMRADGLDVLSGRHGVTPTMDRLAARGATFAKCYSLASWTRPSMSGILTSHWSSLLSMAGTGFTLDRQEKRRIHPKLAVTLSTLHVRRLGYVTAAMGNNFFYLEDSRIGLDRGVEEIVDSRGGNGWDARAVTAAVVRYMERHRNEPFFLWVHYEGCHWPYDPPKGLSWDGIRGARAPGAPHDRDYEGYLGEVKWTDENLATLLASLDRLGLIDDTVIAVTADHGEVFGDAHDFLLLGNHTKHHHGWSNYEEVLHVPLVLAGPGVAHNRVLHQRTSHLNLMPTLLDLAGLPALPKALGRSMKPLVASGQSTRHGSDVARDNGKARWSSWSGLPIVAEGRRQESIMVGRYHLIRRWGSASRLTVAGRSFTRTRELYDLETDPLETKNLAGTKSDVVRRLKALLDRLLRPAAGHEYDVANASSTSNGAASSSLDGADSVGVLHIGLWGGAAASNPSNDARSATRHRLHVILSGDSNPVLVRLDPSGSARLPAKGLDMTLVSASGRLSWAAVRIPTRTRLVLSLDGKTVPAHAVRAGRFALSLLRQYRSLDGQVRHQLQAAVGPARPVDVQPRVLMWFEPGASGTHRAGPGAASGPEDYGPHVGPGAGQVDGLLRQWGYIKKKR
ncbi:MAG: sulfatase [Deltaproteobacteria bacterium]|nr:sulfatase [Deltaproteobacteria bacterium]